MDFKKQAEQLNEQLVQLAKILECTVDELLNG